jgi:hypothetical protein
MIGRSSVAGVLLLLLLLSGCLGTIDGEPGVNGTDPGTSLTNDSEPSSPDDDENATTDDVNRTAAQPNGSERKTDVRPNDSTHGQSALVGGSMQGQARSISLGTITPEMNESLYLPENDTIRYVEFWFGSPGDTDENGSSGLEPHYAYVRFDEWAAQTCAETAARRAAAVARNRTGVDDVHCGVGRANDTRRPLVTVTTLVDRRGNVTATPGVSLAELAAATPRSVQMTLRLDERKERCELEVTAEHSVQRAL